MVTFLCKTSKPTKKSQYLVKYHRFALLMSGGKCCEIIWTHSGAQWVIVGHSGSQWVIVVQWVIVAHSDSQQVKVGHSGAKCLIAHFSIAENLIDALNVSKSNNKGNSQDVSNVILVILLSLLMSNSNVSSNMQCFNGFEFKKYLPACFLICCYDFLLDDMMILFY